jgi:hypothetical protein
VSRPGRDPRAAARRPAWLALVLALAGCAGPLPFQPERQPFGATISADVRTVDGRLRVEIDSSGYRVEWAVLVDDAGATLAPEALVPPAPPESRGGLSIGLGLGAASSGSAGGVSVASGVGIPVGSARVSGNTMAWFPLDQLHPPPWRLRVKVVGVEPVHILLDPAARSGRP